MRTRHHHVYGWLGMRPWRIFALCGLLLAGSHVCAAPGDEVIELPSGVQIVSQRYAADSSVMAIWLTGQFGRTREEHQAAADMAAQGVETWVTDMLAPYFLPLLPSSWSQIPDQDLADWLEQVRQRNPDRRIVLISTGRVASVLAANRRKLAGTLRTGRAGGGGRGFADVPVVVSGTDPWTGTGL
jgi:hypothetical protein